MPAYWQARGRKLALEAASAWCSARSSGTWNSRWSRSRLGRRIVWRADDAHAKYHGGVQLRGAWRVLAPLMAMEGAAGVRRELARLKERVEAVPAPAANAPRHH